MSEHKIAGCCTTCDSPCFEVEARWDAGERNEGEPKRLGKPMNGSLRIAFLLYDGSRTDLTFCGNCAESLNPKQYAEIWRKNMRSWKREIDEKPTEQAQRWFNTQFSNGLLCEMGRLPWKELMSGRES